MGMLGALVSGAGNTHRSIAERYTEPVQLVLESAREEAQLRGSAALTVADLLAGLMVEEGSRAERIGQLKANAFYLRWLAELPALPALSLGSDSNASIEPDMEARRALAFAVLEADRDREYWIDSDHLLRGLLRFPNKADFALLKTELSLDSARVASRKDREKFLPEQNPSLKVVKYLARKYLMIVAPVALSLACYLYILIQELGTALTPVAH
jgi:ATP-dependent Clp protease ATP-binding subunit ClpA